MTHLKIRFIAESGIISDAIKLDTFSEWTHTELITESGTYIGARAKGGVEERPADYCKPTLERWYAIPVTDKAYTEIMGFARSKIGAPYDFKDIAGLFLHHDLNSAGKFICSMFVIQAAGMGGVALLNVLPHYTNLITPEMLHLSPLLIGTCYYDSKIPK